MRRLRAAYEEATGPLRRTLSGREGVAMLIALFVVTVMTMTVVDFAFSVQVDANVAANGSDDLRAFYLARSAQRAGALLLQVGDPTADRDHRFDPWANPTELVLLQLENRGLIHIPQGRVYLGPVDESCSPAVLSTALAATTGSGLQDIIVDENRKLSVGNLVKNRGQANEAADFMTLLMLRNLFANYVDAQIETLSDVYGRIEPDDMAETMVSALVDWVDSDAYARPY
ncbi:MAG: general secretion pathway protein GspK, partial [Candidatus Methylomirabilis sp.]|nr:general secretion pathway protein GspK [Deltaproteobacteria bacterium]